MGELAVGTLFALIEPRTSQLPAWACHLLGLVGASLVAVSATLLSESTPFPGFWALPPTIGAALIIASPSSFVSTHILSGTPLGLIGLGSYSIYLYHWPLMAYLRVMGISFAGLHGFTILCFTGLLSYLSWHYVEKTFRRVTWSNRVVFLFFVTLSFFLAALCFGFLLLSGSLLFTAPQRQNSNTLLPDQRQRTMEGRYEYTAEDRASPAVYHAQRWKDSLREVKGSLASRHLAILAGDSHALQVGFLLEDLTAEIGGGFKFSSLLTGTCMPFFMSYALELGLQTSNCASVMRQLPSFVAKHNASAVILAAYWYCKPSQTMLLKRALTDVVDYFVARNISVLVIGRGPIFPSLRRECPLDFPSSPPFNFETCVQKSSVRSVQAVNEILMSVVQSYCHQPVFYWDVLQYMCPLGECSPYYRGKLLFWEHTHYNDIMAREVAKDILTHWGVPEPLSKFIRSYS
jgi:hypothetical protein